MLEEKAKKLQKRKQLADEKRENDKVNNSRLEYLYALSIVLVENFDDKKTRKKNIKFQNSEGKNQVENLFSYLHLKNIETA